MADGASTTQQNRPLRLGRLASGMMIAFILAGVTYLGITRIPKSDPTVLSCTATRPISAFEIIHSSDVTCGVDMRTSDGNLVKTRADLENHYALEMLPPDSPITMRQVGPALPADFGKYSVVTIQGSISISLGGKLSRGAHVDIFLTPEAQSPASSVTLNAIVLDVRSLNQDSWVVTVATTTVIDETTAVLLADGRAILLIRV